MGASLSLAIERDSGLFGEYLRIGRRSFCGFIEGKAPHQPQSRRNSPPLRGDGRLQDCGMMKECP
jgi:hypothetical protein